MAINKVEYGENVLIDLTEDTVTPETLAEGATAHGANGEPIVGTMKAGGGATSWDDILDKPFETLEDVKEAVLEDVPTKLSELDNDAGFITAEDVPKGVTSWNDLEDKPFGVGATEWKQVVTTSYSIPSIQNGVESNYNIPIPLTFVPVEGKKYKIEVFDMMFGIITKSVTAYCTKTTTSLSLPTLEIGTIEDPVRYSNTIIVANVHFTASGYVGWRVDIYEEVEFVTTLDEKYLPESVVLESELDAKGYQTEAQVTALIDNALGVIENGTY